MKKIFIILLIFCFVIPLVFAENLLEEEIGIPIKIIYQGSTLLKDANSINVLKEETNKVMALQKYPYKISGTEIIINKYKCDEKMGICGYWIEATRNGKEVYTNSPIWISPPPYEVVVSESLDEKANELTVTIKESPKEAVEKILQMYVDMQPLGKAVSYER
jgi:hypothetical protein